MMIEYYTRQGHLEIKDLYEPPFDFIYPDGIDGAFKGNAEVVNLLVERVKQLNEVRVG